MIQRAIACLLVLSGVLAGVAGAQEPPTPWRNDPLFQRLAAALDAVPAIDNHTHLLRQGKFDPELDDKVPLMLRSTHPWLPSMLKARFAITVQPRTRRRASTRSRPRGRR